MHREVLRRGPQRTSKPRAAGLLACAVVLLGSCSAEERQPDATATLSYAAGTSVTPVEPGPATASRMPAAAPSDLEQNLIDAMTAAGVMDPGLDEDGFDTAMVSGAWGTHWAWAHAYPGPEAETPGEVVAETMVSGVPARVVRTEHFGDVLAFWCVDVGYQVTALSGDGRAGSGEVGGATAFAEVLIPYLECTG